MQSNINRALGDIVVDVEGNLRLNRRRLWTEALMKDGEQLNLQASCIFYDPTVNQSSSPMSLQLFWIYYSEHTEEHSR